MSSHIHPPGTPVPAERDAFLIDGCPRCAEYVEDLGVSFYADRFRAFWQKMVAVEYDDAGGYASTLDKQLGRRLYLVSLTLHRAFGMDPQISGDRQHIARLETELQPHRDGTSPTAKVLDRAIKRMRHMTAALETVRRELDLPEHIAEIVGDALNPRAVLSDKEDAE